MSTDSIQLHIRSQNKRPDGTFNVNYEARFGCPQVATEEIHRAMRRGQIVTLISGPMALAA